MSNRWVEHVRKFAKDNNMTYMCAITEASKTYKKTKDDELKSTPKKTTKAIPKEKKDNKNLKFELGTLEKFKRDEDVILDKDPILKRNYLLAFQKNYFTTRDKAFEDLRSKMIDFCVKTNNDKDCHEKFYDDIDDLFRKDLKQYIDRVYNAYLSLLRYVEEFFDKYNGKYSKETITSSKRAKELYDKIVDYFPNNTYVTELGKKLNQKSTQQPKPKPQPKLKPQPQPKPQPKAQQKDDYRISVINKIYDNQYFDFNFTRDFKYKT